ncbi:DUF1761 domain-containing protein [Aeromicrobium sp.]
MSSNWILAVIFAALAFFALGGLWYTVLLGRQWREEVGITDEQMQTPNPMLFVWSILVSLVIAFTLSTLIGEDGTSYGLKVGAGTGAGIGAAVMAQNYVYESKTLRFFAINAAYVVIGLGIMGTIIGTIQG